MALINRYPYTDFENLNLDWIIQKVKELGEEVEALDKLLNEDLDAYINLYIDEHISELMLRVVYDESNTAVIFTL